jgi:hypothetical protein
MRWAFSRDKGLHQVAIWYSPDEIALLKFSQITLLRPSGFADDFFWSSLSSREARKFCDEDGLRLSIQKSMGLRSGLATALSSSTPAVSPCPIALR